MFPVLLISAFNLTTPQTYLLPRSSRPVWSISRPFNHLSNMSQHTLSLADSGKTIALKRGDTITIQLAENPTTGYRWSEPSLENDSVSLQRSQFVGPQSNAPGAGGQRLLTFKAEKPGKTTLSLKHCRDWEGDRSVIERFTLTLQVAD